MFCLMHSAIRGRDISDGRLYIKSDSEDEQSLLALGSTTRHGGLNRNNTMETSRTFHVVDREHLVAEGIHT